MSTNLIPYADMERMANSMAKSNLFGIKTADQALALMVIAQAEGRHPGSVANEYHIIEGRPSLKADAMLARFLAAGGTVKWTDYTDARVAAIFSHPSGGSVEIDWTRERAQGAALVRNNRDGSPGMYAKFPRQMLRARCISEGVRTVFPGVSSGMYTPEETQDEVETLRAVNVTQPETGQAVIENKGKADTQAPQRIEGAKLATESQVNLLTKKIANAGVDPDDFLRVFKVDAIAELPFDSVNEALVWIKDNGRG